MLDRIDHVEIVADITAALAVIGGRGVRLLDQRPRHGSMGAAIAFLHPADVGGVLTELVEAPGPLQSNSVQTEL